MFKQPKTVFGILCFLVFLVNGYLSISTHQVKNIEVFVGGGFGLSLLSIPIWSCIGVVLSNIGLFFYKIIKPDGDDVLTIWQKAGLGLIMAIIFKPLLGITW